MREAIEGVLRQAGWLPGQSQDIAEVSSQRVPVEFCTAEQFMR